MGFAIGSSKDQELAIGGVKVGGFAIGNVKVMSAPPMRRVLYPTDSENLYLHGIDNDARSDTRVSLWRIKFPEGSVTPLGDPGVNYSGSNIVNVSGTLFGMGTSLFKVDRTGLFLSSIGDPGIRGSVSYSELAYHNNELYSIAQVFSRNVADRIDYLVEINKTTGVATRVGSSVDFGISGFQSHFHPHIGGLQSHGGTLYMTALSSFYSLNTTTGVASQIGSSGLGRNRIHEELASFNNVLYTIDNDGQFGSINPTSGAFTRVGSLNYFGMNLRNIFGMFAL